MKKKIARRRGGRRKMSVQEKKDAAVKRENKKFSKKVFAIFDKSGFESMDSEGIHIKFNFDNGDREGELDCLFALENLLVVVEHTHTKSVKEHLSKKLILFRYISKEPVSFLKKIYDKVPAFKNYKDRNEYNLEDYEVRVLYCSKMPVAEEYQDAARADGVYVLEEPLINYFDSLARLVEKTARFEILKYLSVDYYRFGAQIVQQATKMKNYDGYLLPPEKSKFDPGYRIVTFYADPESLIYKSYVLRRNGWEAPNTSYQRLLNPKKIRSMRKYLSEKQRVYVNNIIVSLPANTLVNEIGGKKAAMTSQTRNVKISIPEENNVVGVIDGQHRLFSYYEGTDQYEDNIRSLRKRQNLLVTAIIPPESHSEKDQQRFEAQLFLEINSSQTKVKSDVTHAIEVMVRPFSNVAIAKSVIARLSKTGPLKGKLEEHAFDSVGKVKTTSIVSYGLAPLVKLSGDDSIFSTWDIPGKKEALLKKDNDDVLEEYIGYCVNIINLYLRLVMLELGEKWKISSEYKVLSPTSLNGLLSCLRSIIRAGYGVDEANLKKAVLGFDKFAFSDYKSSQWNAVGKALFLIAEKNM